MDAYNDWVLEPDPSRDPKVGGASAAASRWELYRLLAEPVRPRLLALVAAEELAVGEIAELLREGQPKVSRHAAALREAGLVSARRQGTWTLLRLAPGAQDDAVVADAIAAGTSTCRADGTLARVEDLLSAREEATREFFARSGRPTRSGPPTEVAAYLAALAPLIPHRRLAIDVGTGDGQLLEVLSPVFERVIALDREGEQIALAKDRVVRRELTNVTLLRGEIDGPEALAAVKKHGGADVVFASRVLHHMPVPARAMGSLAALARSPSADARGGAVCVLDYEHHDDLDLQSREADLWLGFDPKELKRLAKEAGLVDVTVRRLPLAWQGEGPDRHLAWQLLVGFRGDEITPTEQHPKKRNS